MSGLSLDDVLGDSKKGNPEGSSDSELELPDTSEQDKSFTEKKLGDNAKNYIGCKNVSAKNKAERGINYSLPIGNGNTVTVTPGSAIAIPRKLWAQIRATRSPFGEIVFEECDLKYCDGDLNSFTTPNAPESKFDPSKEIDESLTETIFLAIKNDVHSEVIELLSTCNSIATLQNLMKEFEASSQLDQKSKTEFSRYLIKRISALRKKEIQ